MGDEESAITVIIENNLQRYIKILRENGLDKKNKAEYIAKVYLYIGELCKEYNFNSSLFLKIFLTPKFVDKYDPTLREAFPKEVSWNEGSDRKIRKIIIGNFSNYDFFIILYILIRHYLHLLFVLKFLEV